MPLKCKKDMAGQDVKENEMTIVSELDYIRGLKEGNSVIIDFSTIKEKLKYMVSLSISDANEASGGEWAYVASQINNYPFDEGYLITLGGSDQRFQFAIKSDGEQMKIRIHIYLRWTNWMTIPLTSI